MLSFYIKVVCVIYSYTPLIGTNIQGNVICFKIFTDMAHILIFQFLMHSMFNVTSNYGCALKTQCNYFLCNIRF